MEPASLSQSIEPAAALHKVATEHLDELQTALWVFDIDRSRVAWANKAALVLWNTECLNDLTARDMSSDMSSSVAQRLKQYQEDFIASNASFSEVWTIHKRCIAPSSFDIRDCTFTAHYRSDPDPTGFGQLRDVPSDSRVAGRLDDPVTSLEVNVFGQKQIGRRRVNSQHR